MKEYKELKLKKKIYSIMNCYEKAGNLYQMIESLIQVFVYHHVFERSCRWQVLLVMAQARSRNLPVQDEKVEERHGKIIGNCAMF